MIPRSAAAGKAALAQARWRAAGEAAFACRPCTARRTGQVLRAVRYLPRWQRVCERHGRWLLNADADQPQEHLGLRGVPEVVAAQRGWKAVVRAALEPGQLFGLAHVVVARWWEAALYWEREEI